MLDLTHIDIAKARRLVSAGDEARDLLQAARARHADARAEAYRLAGRVYRQQPELQGVGLEDVAKWSDADLARAWLTRAEVTDALEAKQHAAALAARLVAVEAAAAPAMKLAARIREHLQPWGVAL